MELTSFIFLQSPSSPNFKPNLIIDNRGERYSAKSIQTHNHRNVYYANAIESTVILGCIDNVIMLWKRLTTEMPQNRGTPPKVVCLSCSEISEKNAEIPENPVFEREPFYFVAFPKIFDIFFSFIFIHIYIRQIFLRNFPIFLRRFLPITLQPH